MKGLQAWTANQFQQWNNEQDRIEDLEAMSTTNPPEQVIGIWPFREQPKATDSPNPLCPMCGQALPQIPAVNAAGVAYPSIEEQENFWKLHDHGGNVIEDRREANEAQYGD